MMSLSLTIITGIVIISSIRRLGRRGLLLPEEGQQVRQVLLDGLEAGARRRGRDVVGVGDAALKVAAVLDPGLLLAAEVGFHPGEGDEGPDAGPGEGERPAELFGLFIS